MFTIYSADVTGNPGNCSYPHKHVILDEASLKALSELICQRVYAGYQRAEFLIPYEKGEILSYFMENAHILEREFEEKGTRLCVSCHRADQEKYKEWLIHGKGTVK